MTTVDKNTQRFVKSGKNVFQASDRGSEIELIPAGVYVLKYSQMTGFFLTQQTDMVVPGKTYGNCVARATKVLKTYQSRSSQNTGVLLSGNKGSGKTMLSKVICAAGVELEMPVILIEEPFIGTEFIQFMNNITQPTIVFIDEFEKKYDDHDKQNGLLSLLDGTGVNNKLYIATTNDAAVSEFLLSRPSRFFYHWRFQKLELEVLEGYCDDNLKNKDFLPKIKIMWGISTDMSFDILQSVVEELNRYPDDEFVDSILDMNIALGNATRVHMKVEEATLGGETVKTTNGHTAIDLIEVHEGKARFSVDLRIDSWEEMKTYLKALGKSNCYHYNYNIEEAEKAGNVTPETMEGFDPSLKLYLGLNFSTDTFSTSTGANIVRYVEGRPLVIKLIPHGGLSEKDILKRLFS